ncbi:cytochrome c oxidase subunit 6B-like [Neltuma alba]|uniref:cytochrome c oxidase subunit 6B-like n=1 Tax=Neltuma alba TaxID=207710 RepID=UPI0010A2D46A|nr:cytochrome c oxidase subunit 6B-like [Prosopis alba]
MAEIELKTAPADFRFPTTNQTRHCFTRYVEFHRCVAAKGEGSGDCERFAKYYRSLCPSEWVKVLEVHRQGRIQRPKLLQFLVLLLLLFVFVDEPPCSVHSFRRLQQSSLRSNSGVVSQRQRQLAKI